MEALSAILQPYSPIVSTLATVVSMAQFFAPAIICKEIYDAKSTKDKPATPFLFGTCIGGIMMIFASLVGDPVMIRTTFIGVGLNCCYTYCYYYYAENKNDLLSPLWKVLVFVGVVYLYTVIENPAYVQQRFGIVMTVLMFIMMASPLFGVKEVMRKRNAEIWPMPMIWCGSVLSTLWFLHGIIIMNPIMVVQNLIGGVLSFVQIIIWFFYHGGTKEVEDKKKKVKKAE